MSKEHIKLYKDGTEFKYKSNGSILTLQTGSVGSGEIAEAVEDYLVANPPTDTTARAASIVAVWDGGGGVLDSSKKVLIEVPYAGNITGWTVVADVAGTVTITVKKCSYADYPGGLTTISGTEPPRLIATMTNQLLTLTTWSTTIVSGDILELSLSTVTYIKWLKVTIRLTKT